MLRFISSYHQIPVLSLRSASTIAYVQKPIVDPKKLQVIGFWVQDSRTKENLLLLIEDIRDHINKGLVVNDHEVLAESEDLVRLKSIIELEFNPIGMLVENTDGHKLGKITEYAVDFRSFYIQKLHFRKGLLSSLGSDLSFSRTQIAELTNKKFIIKSPNEKIKIKKPSLKVKLPSLEQPAYSSTPSASALDTDS